MRDWFCVTREEPEFLTDIRDFTTLFHVNWRPKSFLWLELSMAWVCDLQCGTSA